MAQLYRNARIHQVFGANTDVGKTVITTALALASARRGKQVRYLKPVSTGPTADSDDEYVARYSSNYRDQIRQECLYRFKTPVSPHLALMLENGQDVQHTATSPTDSKINKAIADYIRMQAKNSEQKLDIYVETAGGVHSPSLAGISQVDSYRPLRLPCLLVGDSRLGGISSTVSAYESLSIRGYTLDAVLLFREDYYRNWEYLKEYFAERGVHLASVPQPPHKLADREANLQATTSYYNSVLDEGEAQSIIDFLDKRHSERIEELQTMSTRTLNSVWWPFAQHGLVKEPEDVNVIDSASGDFFSTFNPLSKDNLLAPQFDGSASWWTQTFGHAHPSLAIAAARAAGRYGHVMFPQATHLPALRLTESLLTNDPGKGWASRVFFSDDGSTAMEIAIKMALRAYCVRNEGALEQSDKQKLGVLGLKGSYHGDTIGAMDACYAGDGVYTCEWHSAKGFWFDPPSIGVRDGKAVVSLPPAIASSAGYLSAEVEADSLSQLYGVEDRLGSTLANTYRNYIRKTLRKLETNGAPRLAALVIEPLILGAGGMIFVDPLFQRILVDVAREYYSDGSIAPEGTWIGLPVIYDEVFVGMYRVGWQSCIPILGVKPDIAVYAKMLTGGLLPLAVTLTNKSIFEAFLSDKKADALLHGHSYTAHAVGCEVANESLAIMEKMKSSGAWVERQSKWTSETRSSSGMWSIWDPEFIDSLSRLSSVESVMTLGTVLAIKVKGDIEGYRSDAALTQLQSIRSSPDEQSFDIHYRTLGDVAYFMTSLNTSKSNVQIVQERITNALASN